MSLFHSILNFFCPQLDDDQRLIIQSRIKEIKHAVEDLDSRYTTYQDRHGFSAYWNNAFSEVKDIRIPRRDPLKDTVRSFLERENRLDEIIDSANKAFIISESKRCDALLSDIDGKSLDEQQRIAVICDEDRNLVLAGAGSGKTLTICGKGKISLPRKRCPS